MIEREPTIEEIHAIYLDEAVGELEQVVKAARAEGDNISLRAAIKDYVGDRLTDAMHPDQPAEDAINRLVSRYA